MSEFLKLRRNQQGIVSFLAVMFITILLTIIVMSLVRVMLNEQRVATDFDQSAKAYYAAEAGVEDAIADIQDEIESGSGDPANAVKTTCTPEKVITTGSDNIEYTCQLIDISPILTEGEIKKDNSAQINLDTVSDNFDNITISWHRTDKGVPLTDPPTDLPPNPETIDNDGDFIDAWGSAPAYMKVNIVSYPDTAFSRSEIQSHVFFLAPDMGLSLDPVENIDNGSGSQAPTVATRCSSSRTYACEATFNNLQSDENYVVILKAFYADTDYKFQAKDGNSPVQISGNQVIIDVTGRAGDVFRRVVAKIPLRSNTFGQDYALLTDDVLCKDFDITREDPPRTNETGNPQQDGCVVPY